MAAGEVAPAKILVVDDDASMRRLLRSVLSGTHAVYEASGGHEAVEMAATHGPDLVLLDIMMPGIDGYETCLRLRSVSCPHPPQVIMISAKSDAVEQRHAFEVGADDYLVKPIDIVSLRSRVELHLRLRESQAATLALQGQVDSHHQALAASSRERSEQVVAVQDVAVLALAKVAESRDNDTGAHIIRMRDYAQCLAKHLHVVGRYTSEIDQAFLSSLYRSAPLHDVGKVGIPDAVLLKPGRLTQPEFDVMKRHATIGADILQEVVHQSRDAKFLDMAEMIARFHHERWDGSGYPDGLKGEQIPLAARIVSVADVYDALTSERPYKEAWSPHRARDTIIADAGSHFDPTVVEAFVGCFEEIVAIQLAYSGHEPSANTALSILESHLLETT